MSVIPLGTSTTGAKERSRTGAAATTSNHSSFYLLLTVIIVLNLIGAVMVLSASSVLSIDVYNTPWHYFERQVLWLIVGSGAFVVALRTNRHRWRRLAKPALIVTIILLAAVLVHGVRVAGAARWIGPSFFQIQPSELAKLAFILFTADVLDRRAKRGERGDWRYQMGPVILVFLGLAFLVLLQPDMGTTMVLGLIMLAMIFTAGLPMRPLVGLVGVGIIGCGLLSIAAPYRWRRMTSFLHPLQHASDTGYQAVQGLAALSSGHLIGEGIGNTVAASGYLPNAETDYIFAIIGQETGIVGSVLVSSVFLGLGLIGVRIACGAKDRFSGLLAAGITAWLVGQAIINIGAVVGLLPVTGVPLPFVSFGGSSTVIALFGVGLLANIARNPEA
jgi:cell division protein FtsW